MTPGEYYLNEGYFIGGDNPYWELVDGPGIEIGELITYIATLQSGTLQPSSSTFRKNIGAIWELTMLPSNLVGISRNMWIREGFYYATIDRAETQAQPNPIAVAVEETDRLTAALVAREDSREADRIAEFGLARILEQIPQAVETVRIILPTCVTMAWTAFECLAKDMWTDVLNARPQGPGQRALFGTQQRDETGRKGVPLEVLAQHGFDMRGALGSYLRSSFDFSRINGIKQAYTLAFGKHQAIKNTLDAAVLKELHASRNLLVHRAGVMDEEYIKAVDGELSMIGAPLPLTAAKTHTLINAAINAGRGLLGFLDEWLANNPVT